MARLACLSTIASLLVALQPAWADEPKETDTNFDNHKPIAAGVRKATKVVLHEGLPHQTFEREELARELKAKKTEQLNGFPFYAETLPLKPEDAKKLTDLFCEPKSFVKFQGYKLCGGFHPDYCIEWQDGKDVYRVHVCFGCHEVKCFGPKIELYCDVRGEAYKEFERILKPYRKNRPEKK